MAMQAVVLFLRMAFVITALTFLCFIAKDRMESWLQSQITADIRKDEITTPWFETMICFGPRYSIDVLAMYEYWAKQESQEDPNWPIYDIGEQNFTETDASTLKKFQRFFSRDFHWGKDSPYKVGLYMMYKIFGAWAHRTNVTLLPILNHTFHPNTTLINARIADAELDFFMFHYSVCINYTYDMTPTTPEQFQKHSIALKHDQIPFLLGEGIFAYYADIYLYQKGEMTEYNMIHHIVPFRIDMSNWLRMRAVIQKSVHIRRKGRDCLYEEEDPTYSHTMCMSWCLRRALLVNVNCTIPQLDAFIFNLTDAVFRFVSDHYDEDERVAMGNLLANVGSFRSNETYFHHGIIRPGMHEFAHMLPCDSVESFRTTYEEFRKTFFTSGKSHTWCSEDCPKLCHTHRVRVEIEGVEKHEVLIQAGKSKNKTSNTSEPNHSTMGVTLIFPKVMHTTKEKYMYMWQQLLIDMSGVMSFLLGMSVITIYEWSFFLLHWCLVRCEVLEPEEEEEEEEKGEDDSRLFPAYRRDYDSASSHSRESHGGELGRTRTSADPAAGSQAGRFLSVASIGAGAARSPVTVHVTDQSGSEVDSGMSDSDDTTEED